MPSGGPCMKAQQSQAPGGLIEVDHFIKLYFCEDKNQLMRHVLNAWKYIWGIRPVQSYSYSDWHYSLNTPPVAMAIPSNLPGTGGGGGGGGAARLASTANGTNTTTPPARCAWGREGPYEERTKNVDRASIYSQPWNPTGEYLLAAFPSSVCKLLLHAPQDLQRADCNFASQMERLGEVKLPTGCEDVWRHCLMCQKWHRIQPEQNFCWNDKPTFKGSCKFILSCRMTCNPI